MDWRVITLINSIIAVVTLIAVAFDIEAHHRIARSKEGASDSLLGAGGSRRHSNRHATSSLAQLRVDKLDSVPPSEFYDLFLDASPQEMNALALKFNELPPNVHTAGGVAMFFQAWAELDGFSALEGAFRIKDVDLRKMAADAVVHSVSPGVAPQLATYLVAHPDKDLLNYCQNRFLDALVQRWSGSDPVAAAKFFDSLPNPNAEFASSAGRNIAFAWGSVDPVSALAWTEKSARGEQSELLFYHVIGGWAKTDPSAATAYIAQHANRPGAREAASLLAEVVFKRDPNGAPNWVNTFPTGELKTNAEQTLASEWAQKDPVAAAHWAEGLPKEDQLAAVPGIATLWAGQDWPATRHWITTLRTDVRDEAIALVVSNNPMSRIPPTESLPLATSITDEERRNELIGGIIHNWSGTDPAGAEAWIKRSSLPRAQKEELLSSLGTVEAGTPGDGTAARVAKPTP
jgi:hypothetical protein